MKKLMVILMCLACICFAQAQRKLTPEIIIKSSVVFTASDLTNINKSEYNVYIDLLDTNVINTAVSLENTNLCEDRQFKRHMGEFNCRKEIKYKLSTLENADLIISEIGISNKKKSMIVCTKQNEICDIELTRPITIKKEQIEAKGFIMDPNLKTKNEKNKTK